MSDEKEPRNGKTLPFKKPGSTDASPNTEMHIRVINEVANRAVTARPVISTGMPRLDLCLAGGLRPGSVMLIDNANGAYASGMAVQTIGVAAALAGHPVRVLAPDRNTLTMYQQVVCGVAKIPYADMHGDVSDEQAPALVDACEKLRNADFRDVNDGDLSAVKHSAKTGLLIIDGLASLAHNNEMTPSETLQHLVDDCADMGCALVVVASLDAHARDMSMVHAVVRFASRLGTDQLQVVIDGHSTFIDVWYQYQRFWEISEETAKMATGAS